MAISIATVGIPAKECRGRAGGLLLILLTLPHGGPAPIIVVADTIPDMHLHPWRPHDPRPPACRYPARGGAENWWLEEGWTNTSMLPSLRALKHSLLSPAALAARTRCAGAGADGGRIVDASTAPPTFCVQEEPGNPFGVGD
jgi:hypothetical protein